ncbi:MAG: alpha-1,2-fucosyltransferase [Castellaniella sp.]|nr:alpha-1,2-fucosyltransferase [Castellaniella sp.]
MIYINIQGGLGNQLFQSAFGLVVRHVTGEEIRFLTQSYVNYTYGFKYELSSNFPSMKEYVHTSGNIPKDTVVLTEPTSGAAAEQVIAEVVESVRKHRDVILNGYWANEGYFEDHEDLIRQHLSLTTPSADLQKYGETIQRENVIGVHVRRSEYGHHGIARMDYYRNCIKEIRRRFGDLPVLVFTDEYNVCCFEFSKVGNLQVIKGDIKNPYDEFYLFSKCRHYVLSNSSFSYWAAFFGERPDSMVYMAYPMCVFSPMDILRSRHERWHIIDGAVQRA